MEFFAGGDASDDIQTPQVAVQPEERTPENPRTLPQSEAENAAILEAEEAERDKARKKQGQGSTVLTGSLGSPAEEDETQRKTLLGA